MALVPLQMLTIVIISKNIYTHQKHSARNDVIDKMPITNTKNIVEQSIVSESISYQCTRCEIIKLDDS